MSDDAPNTPSPDPAPEIPRTLEAMEALSLERLGEALYYDSFDKRDRPAAIMLVEVLGRHRATLLAEKKLEQDYKIARLQAKSRIRAAQIYGDALVEAARIRGIDRIRAARITVAGGERIAKTRADADVRIARIRAEAAITITKMRGRSDADCADRRAQAQTDSAERRAAAETANTERRANAQTTAADKRADAAVAAAQLRASALVAAAEKRRRAVTSAAQRHADAILLSQLTRVGYLPPFAAHLYRPGGHCSQAVASTAGAPWSVAAVRGCANSPLTPAGRETGVAAGHPSTPSPSKGEGWGEGAAPGATGCLQPVPNTERAATNHPPGPAHFAPHADGGAHFGAPGATGCLQPVPNTERAATNHVPDSAGPGAASQHQAQRPHQPYRPFAPHRPLTKREREAEEFLAPWGRDKTGRPYTHAEFLVILKRLMKEVYGTNLDITPPDPSNPTPVDPNSPPLSTLFPPPDHTEPRKGFPHVDTQALADLINKEAAFRHPSVPLDPSAAASGATGCLQSVPNSGNVQAERPDDAAADPARRLRRTLHPRQPRGPTPTPAPTPTLSPVPTPTPTLTSAPTPATAPVDSQAIPPNLADSIPPMPSGP